MKIVNWQSTIKSLSDVALFMNANSMDMDSRDSVSAVSACHKIRALCYLIESSKEVIQNKIDLLEVICQNNHCEEHLVMLGNAKATLVALENAVVEKEIEICCDEVLPENVSFIDFGSRVNKEAHRKNTLVSSNSSSISSNIIALSAIRA